MFKHISVTIHKHIRVTMFKHISKINVFLKVNETSTVKFSKYFQMKPRSNRRLFHILWSFFGK